MIAPGSSSYAFADPRGGGRTITVQLHRPAKFTPDSRILMVAHGRLRNGDEYRDYFVPESERRGFLVVAPQFDEAQYPHPHAYNYAEMIDAGGRAQPRDRWLFPVLRAVFDDARRRDTWRGCYWHRRGVFHRLGRAPLSRDFADACRGTWQGWQGC